MTCISGWPRLFWPGLKCQDTARRRQRSRTGLSARGCSLGAVTAAPRPADISCDRSQRRSRLRNKVPPVGELRLLLLKGTLLNRRIGMGGAVALGLSVFLTAPAAYAKETATSPVA